jgi:CheY-like chemotaxis protein
MRKPTILIADDDYGNRFPLVALFEDYGYHVEQAESKQEVLQVAQKADVWIIDARLPTLDLEGIEAVGELVSKGTVPQYTVFFMSVISQESAAAKLATLGISYEWLEKPFEPQFLFEKIRSLPPKVG